MSSSLATASEAAIGILPSILALQPNVNSCPVLSELRQINMKPTVTSKRSDGSSILGDIFRPVLSDYLSEDLSRKGKSSASPARKMDTSFDLAKINGEMTNADYNSVLFRHQMTSQLP